MRKVVKPKALSGQATQFAVSGSTAIGYVHFGRPQLRSAFRLLRPAMFQVPHDSSPNEACCVGPVHGLAQRPRFMTEVHTCGSKPMHKCLRHHEGRNSE